MRRFHLYRHYDTADGLLYIGQSNNAFKRYAEHQQRSDWVEQSVTMRIEHFDTREAVIDAERRAILLERPKFNRCAVSKRVKSTRLVAMRVDDSFLSKLDTWRRQQPDILTRTEAVRRLVDQALSSKGGARK